MSANEHTEYDQHTAQQGYGSDNHSDSEQDHSKRHDDRSGNDEGADSVDNGYSSQRGKRGRESQSEQSMSKRKKIFLPEDVDSGTLDQIKQVEADSGAQILIRGRASQDGQGDEDDGDEQPHVVINAETEDQMERASELLSKILNRTGGAHDGGSSSGHSAQPDSLSHLGSAYSDYGASGAPYTHQMVVPHNMVGLLIGRNGETVKQLQIRSGAQIQISKESDGSVQTNERLVTIQGSVQQVEYAKNEIDRICASEQSQGHELPPGMGDTFTMAIPNNMVGLVIGKSGETIRQIQNRTGARIQVTKDSERDPRSDSRMVTILGLKSDIDKARMEINNIIAMGPQPGRAAAVGAARAMANSPGQCMISVPESMVGLIIGKSGETIKQLQTKSGARIQVQRDSEREPGTNERRITLLGTAREVEAAQSEIRALCATRGSTVTVLTQYVPTGGAAANYGTAAMQQYGYFNPQAWSQYYAQWNQYYDQQGQAGAQGQQANAAAAAAQWPNYQDYYNQYGGYAMGPP